MHLDNLDHYAMTDQPETCHQCGARTDFVELSDVKQLHCCRDCQEVWVVEDEEF